MRASNKPLLFCFILHGSPLFVTCSLPKRRQTERELVGEEARRGGRETGRSGGRGNCSPVDSVREQSSVNEKLIQYSLNET